MTTHQEIAEMQIDEIGIFNIEDIADFPQQTEIYGESIIEEEFIASVKEFGVITPVVLCESEEIMPECEKPYICISGHRRLLASRTAERKSVPGILRKYSQSVKENLDLATIEFLTCNMQREKSERTRLKEFLTYKQKLCRFTQAKGNKRTWENTIFENEAVSRILRTAIKEEDLSSASLNSYDILKEATGYTEYEQKALVVLFDGDWLQKRLDKLRNLGISIKAEEELQSLRDLAAGKYEAGEISLNNAVEEVKKLFKDAEKKLLPKEKKEKPIKVPAKKDSPEAKLMKKLFSDTEKEIWESYKDKDYYKMTGDNWELRFYFQGRYLRPVILISKGKKRTMDLLEFEKILNEV